MENYFFCVALLTEDLGKGSKISKFSFFLIVLVIRSEIHKMLVRIANREDPDQTASEEAV